jgi:hypothetical protein
VTLVWQDQPFLAISTYCKQHFLYNLAAKQYRFYAMKKNYLPLGLHSPACYLVLILLSSSPIPVAPTWSIGHPWNASFHFSFLILRQSAGLLGREISPSQGRYLRQTQKSMPCVEFEPTIPVFEREKTFHALDRATNVIGYLVLTIYNYEQGCEVLYETKRIVYGHLPTGTYCFSEFIYMLPCNELNLVLAEFSFRWAGIAQ